MRLQDRTHEEECEDMREEVRRAREDNRQQQQLVAQSLHLPQGARVDASLQHEMTRLTNENLVGTAVPHNSVLGGRYFIVAVEGIDAACLTFTCVLSSCRI